MATLNYSCDCGEDCEVEASYYQGSLDSLEPDECPHCGKVISEAEIDKLYEKHCIDSAAP